MNDYIKLKTLDNMILSDLTLLLLNKICPALANSVDPDQLASEEANWSGSALFVSKYVNFYQKNPDQVIWLARNKKWAWHLNLFSMTKVTTEVV